jgi:hypothetical protein
VRIAWWTYAKSMRAETKATCALSRNGGLSFYARLIGWAGHGSGGRRNRTHLHALAKRLKTQHELALQPSFSSSARNHSVIVMRLPPTDLRDWQRQ